MKHGLNPQQQAAINQLQHPLLVLAGAGSGKTRVIIEKIVFLIEKAGTPAHGIWAVTFTNKAAREMNSRIAERIDKGARRGLHISTFHTLGLKLIHREHASLGLRTGFSVMDADDSLNLIKSLITQHNLPIEPKPAQWQISQWKNDLLSPEQAAGVSENTESEQLAELYSQYNRQLAACNALDFDDLINRPVQLLRENPEIRERWQNRVKYLLVDEYQDTNTSQYELVRVLVGPRARFTAVGDDHQSIYAWRGARPENLQRLSQDFPTLKRLKLEQNYRSVNTVLQAANQLIAHDETTEKKQLWSAVGEGEPHRVLITDTAEDEADRIATDILHRHFKNQSPYRNFAVLFRGNHQARLIEQALRKLSIPYKLTGGQSFFERSEVKDGMAYLRVLANPNDDAALLRIINTPRRGIGPATLEKLGAIAGKQQISLYQAADTFAFEQKATPAAKQALDALREWLIEKQAYLQSQPAAETIRHCLENIGYFGHLQEQENSSRAAERRWRNIEDWIEWTERVAVDAETGENLDATELVQKMTLLGILDSQTEDKNPDAVSLLTLHAAKGLEFPHVYLSGMEEDLLPHHDCQDLARLSEERRLCFVGITRAQKTLTFTLTRRRRRFGQWKDVCQSRFLDEIDPSLLRFEGVGVKPDKQASEHTAQEAMAAIKAMLNQ